MKNDLKKQALFKNKHPLLEGVALICLITLAGPSTATSTTSLPAGYVTPGTSLSPSTLGGAAPITRTRASNPMNIVTLYTNLGFFVEYHFVTSSSGPPTTECSNNGIVTQPPTPGTTAGTYVYQCMVSLTNIAAANSPTYQQQFTKLPNAWSLVSQSSSGANDYASYSGAANFATNYVITNYVYLGPGNTSTNPTRPGGYVIWESNSNNQMSLTIGSGSANTTQGAQKILPWPATTTWQAVSTATAVLDTTRPGNTITITKEVDAYYDSTGKYTGTPAPKANKFICTGTLTVQAAWAGQTVYVDCCIRNAGDTFPDNSSNATGTTNTAPTTTSPTASPQIAVSLTSNQPCTQVGG